MGTLAITDDGKQSVDDYRSIHRAILEVLYSTPKRIFDLTTEIKQRYHEFRHLDIRVIVQAIDELIKQKLVVSTYSRDML